MEGARHRKHDVRWMQKHPRAGAFLVLYGLGGADRVGFSQRPRLVAFDAGYWDRHGDERRFRISVGGFHCPQRIMQGPNPGPERWESSGLPVRTSGDPDGPILLVGNGPKSNAVGAAGWTARRSRELRAAFPGRRILYRPKPKKPLEVGVDCDGMSGGDIDNALQSVSLVVCRHSNVAVDACRNGVPVVCDDGAAASIYPQDFGGEQPSDATRLEFLHRLAWWQWSQRECREGAMWQWLEGELHAFR